MRYHATAVMPSRGSAIHGAVRLLAAGCTAAALGSGCASRLCGDITHEFDLGPKVEIVELTSHHLLDDRGRLLEIRNDDPWGSLHQPSIDNPDAWREFEQPLRDIDEDSIAVGDRGLIITLNRGSDSWTVVPSGTEADL